MKSSLQITISNRKVLLQFLENYSVNQLNAIPPGFNNNIVWNITHIIVVQQMLLYKLSGLQMMVSDEMVSKYKKGTRPENLVSKNEVEQIKTLLFSTIEQADTDFSNGIFKQYQPFTTMSGYTIPDSHSAAEFNNYHEGVHMGIIMSLRKFI